MKHALFDHPFRLHVSAPSPVLVAGGGSLACQHIQQLLSQSATTRVVVVAPRISEPILALAAQHPDRVAVELRGLSTADLSEHEKVIAATDDGAFNEDFEALAQLRARLKRSLGDAEVRLGALKSITREVEQRYLNIGWPRESSCF